MNKKKFSCVVSEALDTLKYGYGDIKARVKIYKTWMTIVNKLSENNERFLILTGSKAEGVSYADEQHSDIDIMIVRKQLICCDNLHQRDLDSDKLVLKMVRDSTAPGYTRLQCKGSDKKNIIKHHFIVQKFGGQKFVGHLLDEDYLSGSDEEEHFDNISGPAFSLLFSSYRNNTKPELNVPVESLSMDCVLAISCICTDHLQKWKERKRFYSWPGKNLIDEISQMNGHVVPVGNKRSENAHLEWRICYTEAELKLTHSLNEIQLKLYVLLRMVAKKILKPICADISSYVVKNILFWFVERSPAYRFKDEHLMGLLYLALRSLQHCIHRKHLSNYMIPERNLFAGRFDDAIKTRLVEELHQLIYVQGPSFLLHYEAFKPLRSAVEKIKVSNVHGQSKPKSAMVTHLSKCTQDFLQNAFQDAKIGDEYFLNTVLTELTEKQIEHNICDIKLLVDYN